MFKYLEPIRHLNIDDPTSQLLVAKAYQYYSTHSSESYSAIPDANSAKAFSAFVRYFKCINSNKKIDEDLLQNYLKNEVLKGKPQTISLINTCIAEIISIQRTRILFSETIPPVLPSINIPNSKGKNIRFIKSFDYRIDAIISSNYCNRLLVPEIYFIFTLDDGSIIKMRIDIRLFNEFRKNLSLNIKKIIENESVNLLK